ncbi:hypothetical protein [Pengzhenrongella phosphoraccumulans]|jgi:hypothetical protein|uniref:hypothetical protein n=1 Tax=Pengzhenrongella phosphoraccumulans TaxID=3114394 RepID=UPI00388D547A
MLLVLEVLAYAVRHPEARPELAGLIAASIGVLAVANIAAMLAAISVAPRLSIDAGARVVRRLLGREG